MKKIGIGIMGIVVLIAVVAGAYWFGTRSENGDKDEDAPTVVNAGSGIPREAVRATYEPYAGSNATGYIFDTILEWTNVAPSEVEKALSPEQLHGYAMVYYAANARAAVFAVMEKQATAEVPDFAAAVADDITNILSLTQQTTVTSQRVNASDARIEMRVTTQNTDYTVYSRYLSLPATNDGRVRWVNLEVSIPTPLVTAYSEVVTHLLDSLQIK